MTEFLKPVAGHSKASELLQSIMYNAGITEDCVVKRYKKQNALIQFTKNTSLIIMDCSKIMDNYVRSETASYNLIMNF